MSTVEEQFIKHSRALLTKDYLPKVRICVGVLSRDDLWWKPNSASNSVGNLLLHLSGNIRQWIVSGLGGAEDRRQRHLEFAPEREHGVDALLENLEDAVSEADGALSEMDPQVLSSHLVIQGVSTTGLKALYHTVEHFSMHTGQVVYITKLRSGKDLAFYRDVQGGIALAQWPGREESSD